MAWISKQTPKSFFCNFFLRSGGKHALFRLFRFFLPLRLHTREIVVGLGIYDLCLVPRCQYSSGHHFTYPSPLPSHNAAQKNAWAGQSERRIPPPPSALEKTAHGQPPPSRQMRFLRRRRFSSFWPSWEREGGERGDLFMVSESGSKKHTMVVVVVVLYSINGETSRKRVPCSPAFSKSPLYIKVNMCSTSDFAAPWYGLLWNTRWITLRVHLMFTDQFGLNLREGPSPPPRWRSAGKESP